MLMESQNKGQAENRIPPNTTFCRGYKDAGVLANSEDTDQTTAPIWIYCVYLWSGSALTALSYLSENLVLLL